MPDERRHGERLAIGDGLAVLVGAGDPQPGTEPLRREFRLRVSPDEGQSSGTPLLLPQYAEEQLTRAEIQHPEAAQTQKAQAGALEVLLVEAVQKALGGRDRDDGDRPT